MVKRSVFPQDPSVDGKPLRPDNLTITPRACAHPCPKGHQLELRIPVTMSLTDNTWFGTKVQHNTPAPALVHAQRKDDTNTNNSK